MHRCFELARLGEGNVAANPMVGAVLVYNDRIIGEGYHRQYGEAHAEVNCINSVSDADIHLVEKSALYVSLEPCAHFGKTPPCVNLIIEKKISMVVIGCRDSFEQVDGKGIQQLLDAGIKVITPVLEKQALDLNKRFFTFHNRHRPFIILKWAQTVNGKIAKSDYSRLLISNEITNREVHKWRSREAAILVGTNTALHDDPSLATRLWPGNNPVRLVIDRQLKLPFTLQLFDRTVKTIVFNAFQHLEKDNLVYYKISNNQSVVTQILEVLYHLKIQSVLVEGGRQLLQSFINENYWDEAVIITNTGFVIQEGIQAPLLTKAQKISGERFYADTIDHYKHI